MQPPRLSVHRPAWIEEFQAFIIMRGNVVGLAEVLLAEIRDLLAAR